LYVLCHHRWTAQQLRNATIRSGVRPRGPRRWREGDPDGGSRAEYEHFNESRPHQGIGQRVPTKPVLDIDLSKPIEVTSVLGGLHVDYRRVA
jgi:hypothetical protein